MKLFTIFLSAVVVAAQNKNTIAYQAALATHAADEGGAGAPCPTFVADSTTLRYVLAGNGAGCCAPTATAAVLGKKAVACCPNGSHCTGFFPKVLDWKAANGKFIWW
jgi:hypothetical protein